MTSFNGINTGHYIAQKWCEGQGQALISTNPIDNVPLWQGFHGRSEEVQEAFMAAEKALPTWSALPLDDRIAYLQTFAKIVAEKCEALNLIISQETGKPLWESATETQSVIAKIDVSILAYQERTHEKIKNTDGFCTALRFKPQGVVVVLGAFNFPAHLSNGHIVPALLAGNTLIYKPSELSPAVAAFVMQCWHESGIPKGVINCVQGGADTGRELLSLPVQGVFFTGSYLTGKQIHKHFSERPEVILALEMGGNNPLIVDEGIGDCQAAIYNTLLSAFLTAGQRCTAARRIFIKDNEEGTTFLNQLIAACNALKVGAYTEQPEPFMGPVISYEQALHHLQAQAALVAEGGEPLLEMRLLRRDSGLLSPGLIDMSQVHNPKDEEIFAPLLQVYRYQSFEEALQQANQTRFGLVAGLLSNKAERYQQFYNTMRAGLINWNKPTTGALSSLPFGGVGLSGNHRPSAWSAADYCAYPIASLEQACLSMPEQMLPGMEEI